jgi:hypothetical protein
LAISVALSGLEVHARGEVRYSLPGVGVGVQFIDIPENAIHSIEREIRLSRRTPRPARRAIPHKLHRRELNRRKLNRKSTRRKRAKSKATPRKPR